MTPLERYLDKLHAIHTTGAGVAETSYYGALETLLNSVGAMLSPAVRCVPMLRNQGAGMPDGGLFSAEQWQGGELPAGQLPARGAIEVKPVSAEVAQIAASEQVRRYLALYGIVLVTTYRAFLLVGRNEQGEPVILESHEIASDEASFWQAARHAAQSAAQHNTPLVEFLQRAMQHAAPLRTPVDVAWFLASYAREALALLEGRELRALDTLRSAFEAALGIRFEGERGDHFFRSTLVQTLFYGVFSAWVLWHREAPRRAGERFEWRLTPWLIRVPMIRALFEQVALPSRLGPLGLVTPLSRAAETLNRVEQAAFFASFAEELAVQHFYEPFLEQFDPALRRDLGVWYTPPEIVTYMVARVDQVLREELNIPLGLADERVLLLDPASGTGAYLVAALKHIAATLQQEGSGALLGADLKKAATERLFGFEILPAPFVVAHLQLGLLLQQYHAGLDPENERIGVYLTNALTGWKEGNQPPLPLPEFQEEREAADGVKQQKKILVVLGNPPYNGFAGVAMQEERDLSDAYRTTRHAPKPRGQGLNDLYVRFYRMAERQIVERSGHGVVCFISNNSWLDGLSHTGMRERYLEVFDRIWIDNLHGDRYKTGKKTPSGEPDPSVFSTEMNREGIQVGTAIALMVRHEQHQGTRMIFYRDFWGRNKRRD
ncbi:MAG: N-6 DNA methylase, partial [Ardenticatenales bacterium]|nr:N-6 DNA methylase [Ardenticatenales bacterium]